MHRAGGEGGICASRRAQNALFPLMLRSNKIRLQPMNVLSLRKGSLEIAPQIKEGIYPHDCLAEKAISIVC